MTYTDISSYITLNYGSIVSAVCKAGWVYLTFEAQPTTSTTTLGTISYPYRGQTEVYGFVNHPASRTDMGKLINARISSSGTIVLNPLEDYNYEEAFTFIYPVSSI